MKRQITFALTFIFGLALTSNAQETIIKDTSKKSEVKLFEETMPEFPGGVDELMKFINNNMKYANNRDKKTMVGIVKLSFVIEKDGSIGDTVRIIQSLSEYYNEEAIQIVKSMPKWTPGMQNGEPVRVQFNLPIKF